MSTDHHAVRRDQDILLAGAGGGWAAARRDQLGFFLLCAESDGVP